jgi:hypothetical protein
MRVQFLKFGEGIRTIEVPRGARISEVLLRAGEDPSDLAGYRVSVYGEAGEARLDRPVQPEETILMVPKVEGGR